MKPIHVIIILVCLVVVYALGLVTGGTIAEGQDLACCDHLSQIVGLPSH